MPGIGQTVFHAIQRKVESALHSDVVKQLNTTIKPISTIFTTAKGVVHPKKLTSLPRDLLLEVFHGKTGKRDGAKEEASAEKPPLKSILKKTKKEESHDQRTGRRITFSDNIETQEIPLYARRHFCGLSKRRCERFYVVKYTRRLGEGIRKVGRQVDEKTHLLWVGRYHPGTSV